jgi:hypothetical protein
MKNQEKQLTLFDATILSLDLSMQEITNFHKKSKSRSEDIKGALSRLMQAKRYHEIAHKLSEELIKSRMENDKLKHEIRLLTRAN